MADNFSDSHVNFSRRKMCQQDITQAGCSLRWNDRNWIFSSKIASGLGVAYILDSMPIPICKNIRIKASKICKDDENVLPTTTYHASHKPYYYGFKLQLLITKKGIPHTAALTTASMHDSQYLACFEDVQITDCELIADMGYLSEAHQLNLFDSYKIKIITPLRGCLNLCFTVFFDIILIIVQ